MHHLAEARKDGGELPEALGLLLEMRSKLQREQQQLARRDAATFASLVQTAIAECLHALKHYSHGAIAASKVATDGRVSALERRSVELEPAQRFAKEAV